MVDLLTRNKKVDLADLRDAKDLAGYLTKMASADLRRLGTWLYFDGTFDEHSFLNAVRRLETEDK